MDKVKKIKDILQQHCGRNNKITSSEIANLLNITEDDTHATTRGLILESAKKYNLPLAADTRGYYLITNEEEYNDYMNNLESRIEGIKERKELITKNFKGDK